MSHNREGLNAYTDAPTGRAIGHAFMRYKSAMLLREVEYARPATIEDALVVLGSNPNARALAGGQTLVNVMKARAAAPDVLVDLNGLDGLRQISVGADGGLELGAMATYASVMQAPEVHATRPVVAEVAGMIGDVQVRNRGTVGGNVCTGDPTNHFPPLMVALGATMTVRGSDGEREVPADEFFLGVYMTQAGPGELLTKISIPPADGQADGFAIVPIGKDGTAIVLAAACVRANGSIQSVRVTLGCVDAVPVRLQALESRLAGGDTAESAVRESARGTTAELDPPSDVHASADYRRHLAEVVAVRAVVDATGRARR
jgi:aerobic carbon-monoxide dehydrogenase medium subunit